MSSEQFSDGEMNEHRVERIDAKPRRRRWVTAVLVLVLLAALLAKQPALLDAETGATVTDAALYFPWTYIALAPLTSLLDTMTLLTARQHIAFGVTVLLGAILLMRPWRARLAAGGAERSSRLLRAAGATLAGAALGVAILAGVYAAGTLLPRPMARLVVNGPDVVTVDFHSHTSASHDGRRGFTAEANRAWHRAAGFDVAYITDHGRTDAARQAAARNQPRAGDGTVILAGSEFVYRDAHVIGLGADTEAVLRDRTALARSDWPVVIHTIPGRLANLATPDASYAGGTSAIEIADACPRGFEQATRDRWAILRLADSLDLAVVASSNDHGWSRSAAAWSLLRIPAWQYMSPATLDSAIRETILRRRRHAVRVVLRRPVPGAASIAGVAFTMPAVVWTTFATQSFPARVAAAFWIGLALFAPAARRRLALSGGRRAGRASHMAPTPVRPGASPSSVLS